MSRRMEYTLLALLLLGHFLLAFAYSALNLLGEAPDEADHWAYIVHLAREHEFPKGAKMTQAKHPPLYHISAALVATISDPTNDFLRANPEVEFAPRTGWSPNFFIHTARERWPWQGGVLAFHLVRLWSVLLSTAAVAAVYFLARTALPNQRAIALGATALLAFLPEFAFIGGSANNDNAAALFGTLGLWGAFVILRHGGRWRPGWWTPLALGLGLLSKVSTLSLWPVVGVAILLGAADTTRQGRVMAPAAGASLWMWVKDFVGGVIVSWRRWLVTGLAVFLPALLIGSPWLLRNWLLYGDPLGMELVRQTIDLRTAPWGWGDTAWLLQGWFVSFWGRFGGAGHIPMPDWLYLLLAGVTLVSLLGVASVFVRRAWCDRRVPIFVLVLAVMATAFGIWQYSLTALGTDQGRLLYPAIGALVILFTAGILSWLPQSLLRVGTVALGGASLLLGVYGLFGVLLPAFAPPATIDLATIRTNPEIQPGDFGDLTLTSWDLEPEPVLYWRADVAPSQDWRRVIRVTASDGTLVWEGRGSPGGGRWNTELWPAGVVVRDPLRIGWPDWAGPGEYGLEIGLAPFGGDLVVPARADGATPADGPYLFVGTVTR